MSTDAVAVARLRRAVRADAAARAGRHGDGAGRRHRLRLDRRPGAGAEAGRPDLDAHGHRLHVRRDPDVPADGRLRLGLRHEPRDVPRGQHVPRPLRGGLGIATIVACGGFAAICGSSVATAATFSTVAYPEMRRFGYPQSFSTGVIAAGGTLGAMLPPSTVLAVYGILTQQDIGKLFMAGILPGPARDRDVHDDDRHHRPRPAGLPARRPAQRAGASGSRRCATCGRRSSLFVFVIGGLYGGFFTPTEAGGVGASGAFLISVARGKLNPPASARRCCRRRAPRRRCSRC